MKRKFSLHTKEVIYVYIGNKIHIPSPEYAMRNEQKIVFLGGETMRNASFNMQLTSYRKVKVIL